MVHGSWLMGMVGLVAVSAAAAGPLSDRVLVVYNEQQPESKPLAEYYAAKRNIPTNQICGVDVRASETITRDEFQEKIREPIVRFMVQRRLLSQRPRSVEDQLAGTVPGMETVDNRICYVALMYGVPLRIAGEPVNEQVARTNGVPAGVMRTEAAVDSELALLPTVGAPAAGPLRNPFFGTVLPRFEPPLNQKIVLVGRLDGPDAQIARRLVDDALRVEQYGLHGRAYFDAQGTPAKEYMEGDDWIRASYRLLREAGFESELDEKLEVFDQDYPMTDVAVYAGWYAGSATGPFRREGFRFKPGAVAYHLHSASGASIRSREAFWVGPLLAKGAAATMGNVYEPYLSMTPQVDKFFRRLLDGATFLEAGYFSEPVLSWQTTFVGDPLYRPFAVPLDEQIARLEAEHSADVAWAYLRKINLMTAHSQWGKAEKLCRAKAESLSSPVLYEKLGDLLHVTHRNGDGIEAYGKAIRNPADSYQYIRVAKKLAAAYEANKQTALALAIYEGLATAYPRNRNVIEFYQKARDLAETMGNEAKVKSLQAKIDSLLGAEKK
jgi:uncharacterized protein (TIGR03790 family)